MHFKTFNNLRGVLLLALTASLLSLSGCCLKDNKTDPLEAVNRRIFRINRTIDGLYIKPAAQFYDKFLPKPFRYATNNFFQNLREIPTIVNDMLQLKFREARMAAARFCINTTWGVAGFIDVASLLGKIEKHLNDFGLTMAHYGYKESIYVVWPLIGPSTFRDGIGLYVDTYTGVWPYIRPQRVGWTLYALYLIDARAKLLQAEPIIAEAAVDEYTFIRDAYLQHRRYQMNMFKEPVLGDLEAADLPDDNEARSGDSTGQNQNSLAADMPDDNENLSPDHKSAKDKDEKDKDKDEKPKVGAAAVAALEVDDIYHTNAEGDNVEVYEIYTNYANFPYSGLYLGAQLQSNWVLSNPQSMTLAPCVFDCIRVKIYLPHNASPSTDNPDEFKGTSTVTNAVGGK